jgi:hypothetical protein
MILYHKIMPKVQLLRGIFVTYQHKGWMSNEVLEDWLAVVWSRRPGVPLGKQGMLVSDAFKSLTPEIKAIITRPYGHN